MPFPRQTGFYYIPRSRQAVGSCSVLLSSIPFRRESCTITIILILTTVGTHTYPHLLLKNTHHKLAQEGAISSLFTSYIQSGDFIAKKDIMFVSTYAKYFA